MARRAATRESPLCRLFIENSAVMPFGDMHGTKGWDT